MDAPKKLVSQQKTEESQELQQQQTAQSGAREFAGVEELLRYDANHTPVPPGIGRRLEESAAQVPPPARSWWRRLLGQ